jgi:hypothetical protein
LQIEESIMSKGQRGNKEAKKPKKEPVPVAPAGAAAMPMAVLAAPNRFKKK